MSTVLAPFVLSYGTMMVASLSLLELAVVGLLVRKVIATLRRLDAREEFFTANIELLNEMNQRAADLRAVGQEWEP